MTALRSDLNVIADLIESGSRVLDIGCGQGELLAYLLEEKQADGRGIELNAHNVSHCVSHGLSVIQGDADTDLSHYPDQAYDYAVLSKALQVMQHPKEVLEHLVRIASHAVVSIPNFAYWKNRLYLGLRGRMPVTHTLSYEWYETPNIHFCTIRDFIVLCEELGFTIEQRISVTADGQAASFGGKGPLVNLLSEQAVFLIRK